MTLAAEDVLGKTVLVGLTYLSPDGEVAERHQVHGIIESVDEDAIGIRRRSGELFTLPPTLEPFERAAPGHYELRSTGEVVVDPDLLCRWTIRAPDTS